jgi:glycosyltransferase involved in cell wall biosynthesis
MDTTVRTEEERLYQDNPAIGVVATGDSGDALARIALRADRRGYSVLVAARSDTTVSSVEVINESSAVLISFGDTDLTEESHESQLVEAARQLGFPGIVVHRHHNEHIDFEAISRAQPDAGVEFFKWVADGDVDRRQECKTAVGIPAYNEADRVGEVIDGAKSYVDIAIVVDDGSDDGTADVARQAGAVVVEHPRNRGYGAALQTLFDEAERRNLEHIVILDADGQHSPADIPKLIDKQQETGAELVVGNRYARSVDSDVPLYRRVGLEVVNVLTNLSMGVIRPEPWIRDTQNGFRAYDRRAIRSLAETKDLGESMSASTDILHHAHNQGYEVKEVGTTVRYDVGETSTHNPLKHGVILLSNILRTVERERPFIFFGFPGMVSSFVGLGLAYWAVVGYRNGNTFFPELVVVASFATVVGLLMFFTAMILNAFRTQCS